LEEHSPKSRVSWENKPENQAQLGAAEKDPIKRRTEMLKMSKSKISTESLIQETASSPAKEILNKDLRDT